MAQRKRLRARPRAARRAIAALAGLLGISAALALLSVPALAEVAKGHRLRLTITTSDSREKD
jgi:hypothetical protein